MKIREIYIEGFGKLSGMKLTLSDGLNVLKRENGFGKTTLTVFIKAMLYGLDKTKKQSISENDRKHYLPWNGGRCGGSLTFETEGKIYRIERTFAQRAQDDVFKLYDCTTGKLSDAFGARIGEELFGVDEDGFLRTVFLSEENLGGNDNKTVAAKLTSLVGCDGDLSSLDSALMALEEERRIYYKRGGGGEISDISRRIAELDVGIAEQRRLETELRENESGLAEATVALSGARSARDAERQREREAGKERVRRAYVKQYADMARTLKEDEEKLKELDAFFMNGIPSPTEIEDMRAKMSELSLLRRRAESTYKERGSFGGGVSEEEYKRAKDISERLTRLDGEISALRSESEGLGFVSDLPDEEEIGKAILGIKKRRTLSPLIPVSFLLLIASALLGYLKSPVFYALSAVALPLLILGAWFSARRKKQTKISKSNAKDLIKRVTGMDVSDKELPGMLSELERMRKAADARRESLRVRLDRIEALRREVYEITLEAERFIEKFDGISDGSAQSRLNDILIKRRAWLEISGECEARDRERRDGEMRSAELKTEIENFLSGFRTESARPLDEISSNLTHREALLRTIERTRESVRAFKEEHGITSADLALLDRESPIGTLSTPSADTDVSRYEAERALLERKCKELSVEISSLEGLEEEQAILLSKKAEYEKRLRTVTKTKELLLKASDSLTSKYLSKTKEAFEQYVSLINRTLSGGFSMTTSFGIMRSEGGTYREAEAYSRGTRDLYSFALRLALIESLYGGERPFIILDDPFAHLDDVTLKNAKALVKTIAKDKQIIYLTCTDAREFH